MNAEQVRDLLRQLAEGVGQRNLALRCECENLETVYVTVGEGGDVLVTDDHRTFQYLADGTDSTYIPLQRFDMAAARRICKKLRVELKPAPPDVQVQVQVSVLTIDTLAAHDYLRVMARRLRIQYPGAMYHVMNRGDQREAIFQDDEDREKFLATLGEACEKTEWQVHAYCLMSNHFHLVLETPQPNLVLGMKWLLGVYTKRFNIRHQLCGHLFAGRYKALLVEGSGNGYLRTVCDYVHLNPARARLLPADAPLERFRWSSYGQYLKPSGQRPGWLRVDRLLGEKGIPRDSEAGRKQFALLMERRRAEESAADYDQIRRDWVLGSEAFRQELLAAATERVGPNHYGAQRYETGVQKAERIVPEELRRLGWPEDELRGRPKGHSGKVIMARRLRQETTMSLKWIAQRLQMGSWTYVSNLLHENQNNEAAQAVLPMCQ